MLPLAKDRGARELWVGCRLPPPPAAAH